MSLYTLNDLLVEQVQDLYSAQAQYADILPAMIDAAADEELREQLLRIAADVENALAGLQRICEVLAVPPTGSICEAMRGLVREARGNVGEFGDAHVIDAALIANAQRIAHYGIAGFGTARQFARLLRLGEVADVLDGLARNVIEHDRALTRVAAGGWFTSGVNQRAEMADRTLRPQ